MKIDIQDLLSSVSTIKTIATRVGLPDGPTLVEVDNPLHVATSLDAAMRAFQELRPGTQTLVSAEVNAYRKEVWVRILQNGPSSNRDGQVEASLASSFNSLRTILERSGGELHYRGGNNSLDISLPYPNIDREEFLEVENLPWDERYRVLLEPLSGKGVVSRSGTHRDEMCCYHGSVGHQGASRGPSGGSRDDSEGKSKVNQADRFPFDNDGPVDESWDRDGAGRGPETTMPRRSAAVALALTLASPRPLFFSPRRKACCGI